MTKRRKRRADGAMPVDRPPMDGTLAGIAASPTPAVTRATALIVAAIAACLCLLLGWLSRHAVNPDGVSYLDLAALLRRGDLEHFVQGYWSPALPALLAAIAAVTGAHGTTMVGLSHALNSLAAVGALFIVWRWSEMLRRGPVSPPRSSPSPFRFIGGAERQATFSVMAVAAIMLVSAGPPRIEAVTPDLLLLAVTVWVSYEICVQSARRWLLLGALLGATYWIKTSSWPWLIVAAVLLVWLAPSNAPERRLRGIKSIVVLCVIAAAWIVPMSVKYGRFTVGSTGALNFRWYIRGEKSRLPDTDQGSNRDYRSIVVGADTITLAVFDDATDWTYQPWGDPTAWHESVIDEVGTSPTFAQLLLYWLRLAGNVFGIWLLPTILAVIVPGYLLYRRPEMFRTVWTSDRPSLIVMVLGLVGVGQFVLLHAEPRLLAPYAAMLALGALHWVHHDHGAIVAVRRRWPRFVLVWLGIAVALGAAVPKYEDAFRSEARLQKAAASIDAMKAQARSQGIPIDRIAVVGPAIPVLGVAYWLGAHIAEQIPPTAASQLDRLPFERQDRVLRSVFGGRISMVWRTQADGGMQMLIVPPR